jgi:anhydro-N-acetylmuramic acid kinase
MPQYEAPTPDPRFTGIGPFTVVGTMSGTSLDGLDLAQVVFWKEASTGPWQKRIESTHFISYAGTPWAEELPAAYTASEAQRFQTSKAYSHWLNEQLKSFVGDSHVDAIASHGHTVAHEPEKRFTLQIGNDAELALGLPCPVVCDFRIADVARGGQGAPLVPVADALLYGDYPICLNLGGFSNASWDLNGQRRAGDLGPANFILNPYAKALGHLYDPSGTLARSGQPNPSALQTLENLPYYQQPFPKSLGREWVEAYIDATLQPLNPLTALSTATEHSAWAVAKGLAEAPPGKVLTTGGGAKNSYLLERIEVLSGRHLEVPSEEELNFKEAICFAFLGLLRLRGEKNVWASVTGGPEDGCDGTVFEDLT